MDSLGVAVCLLVMTDQIGGTPKQDMVEILAAEGPQVGSPSLEGKEWIIIQAEIPRYSPQGNGLVPGRTVMPSVQRQWSTLLTEMILLAQ